MGSIFITLMQAIWEKNSVSLPLLNDEDLHEEKFPKGPFGQASSFPVTFVPRYGAGKFPRHPLRFVGISASLQQVFPPSLRYLPDYVIQADGRDFRFAPTSFSKSLPDIFQSVFSKCHIVLPHFSHFHFP
jgi:hypothetical protein